MPDVAAVDARAFEGEVNALAGAALRRRDDVLGVGSGPDPDDLEPDRLVASRGHEVVVADDPDAGPAGDVGSPQVGEGHGGLAVGAQDAPLEEARDEEGVGRGIGGPHDDRTGVSALDGVEGELEAHPEGGAGGDGRPRRAGDASQHRDLRGRGVGNVPDQVRRDRAPGWGGTAPALLQPREMRLLVADEPELARLDLPGHSDRLDRVELREERLQPVGAAHPEGVPGRPRPFDVLLLVAASSRGWGNPPRGLELRPLRSTCPS